MALNIDTIRKNLPNFNHDDDHLLCGFTRKSIRNETVCQDLMHLITYFYLPFDSWSRADASPFIQLSNNDTCIQNVCKRASYSPNKSIFGETECVSPHKYEWTLEVVSNADTNVKASNIIGIAKVNENKPMNAEMGFLDRPDAGFGLADGLIAMKGATNMGLNIFFNSLLSETDTSENYGTLFGKSSDVMTVCLDMGKHTLSYRVNGVDYGKAFDVDSGCKYRLAVSLSAGIVMKLCDKPQ